MRVLGAIVEDFVRAVQVVSSVDSKIEPAYVEALMPEFRAQTIIDMYNGTRFMAANRLLASQWFQNIEINKLTADQEETADYAVFRLGSHPIMLDEDTNGLTFVGNKNSTRSFKQARSHEHLVQIRNKGYLDGREMWYLMDGSNLLIYGNKAIKKIFVKLIAADPVAVSGFNPDTDNYPVPETMIPYMREIAVAKLLGRLEQTVPDVVGDENNQKRGGLIK